MAEYVMDYDGWADGMPIGEYLKVRDVMHERKRERIVRCRDCCCFHRLYEDGTGICVRHQHATAPDGFCAWGERKEVDA